MKPSKLFDAGKSPVENAYYLLMILSVAFIVIQVIVARDSLRHNSQLQLTQHTIEQDNRYRVAIEAKVEEFADAMMNGPYPTDPLRLNEIMMQPDNLEEMTRTELEKILPFDSLLLADMVELDKVFQIQNDLATELEQYAFFVLNGFLFEELAYRDLGSAFLRCANLAAVPAIYVMSYAHYNHYQITINQHVRQLYDIWWHREQIDKCNNRIAICRSILSDDQHEIEFLRAGEIAELSLTPDELRATIGQMETKLVELEKILAGKLSRTSVRNM
ncbi:MAG: hypothetical protein LBU97_05680 [Alistipes sp.]|jgi:hypothetical protein|nr:hypothetical protein [Alistipes sp.]